MIDLALVIAAFAVMAILFDGANTSRQEGADVVGGSANLTGTPFLVYILLVFAYYSVMDAVCGQTVGKMIAKVKVTMDDGSPCTWGSALLRNILRPVDGLPFAYLLGLAAISVTQRKQRLGYLAAKTLVVRAT